MRSVPPILKNPPIFQHSRGEEVVDREENQQEPTKGDIDRKCEIVDKKTQQQGPRQNPHVARESKNQTHRLPCC